MKIESFKFNRETINTILKWLLPVLVILIASVYVFCTSPLYKPDTFDDINAMLTIGRSMLHGAVPLKSLVDQRGPIIYFIFFLAALISPNGFTGIWIIEIINALLVYYFAVRICKSFHLRSPQWIGLLGPIVLLGTSPIYGGGSPEEFAFTSILYLISVIVGAKGNVKNVTYWSYFWVALNMALVFWSKYSLIGAFIIFFLWAFFYCVDTFNFKKLLKIIAYSLAGFLTVTFIIFLYYAVNGAMVNLFKVYFFDNITMYNVNPGTTFMANVISRIVQFGSALITHFVFLMVVFAGYLIAEYRGEHFAFGLATFLGELGLVALSGETGNLLNFPCPFLVFLPYMVLALVQIVAFVSSSKMAEKSHGKNIPIFATFLVFCLFVLPFMNNLYLNGSTLRIKTSTMTTGSRMAPDGMRFKAQPDFGRIMDKKKTTKRPTMLMLNSLDEGFFLSSKALPTTPYWHQLNLPNNPDMFKSFVNTISHKKVQFLVLRLGGKYPKKADTITKNLNDDLTHYSRKIAQGYLTPQIKSLLSDESKAIKKNYRVISWDSNFPEGTSKNANVVYYALLERK